MLLALRATVLRLAVSSWASPGTASMPSATEASSNTKSVQACAPARVSLQIPQPCAVHPVHSSPEPLSLKRIASVACGMLQGHWQWKSQHIEASRMQSSSFAGANKRTALRGRNLTLPSSRRPSGAAHVKR